MPGSAHDNDQFRLRISPGHRTLPSRWFRPTVRCFRGTCFYSRAYCSFRLGARTIVRYAASCYAALYKNRFVPVKPSVTSADQVKASSHATVRRRMPLRNKNGRDPPAFPRGYAPLLALPRLRANKPVHSLVVASLWLHPVIKTR